MSVFKNTKHSIHTKKTENTIVETMVYFFGEDEMLSVLIKSMEKYPKVALAGITGENWNDDLSPWRAEKVFSKGEDFGGGAKEYLKFLCEEAIPKAEQELKIVPQRRILMGYSLAGLFANYAIYETDFFSSIASVSGSLWFDGFVEFAKKEKPIRVPEKMYFSLGDREKMTKNVRMAQVERCTKEMELYLKELGSKTIFELNSGNHFYQVEKRMEKALLWLIG